MKIIITILTSLTGYVLANSSCSKNAWVEVVNIWTEGNQIKGNTRITSGKDAMDISWDAYRGALSKCMFDGSCSWQGYDYTCTVEPGWTHARWKGQLNIEFECGSLSYDCNNKQWWKY